jgi:hypothetical protein
MRNARPAAFPSEWDWREIVEEALKEKQEAPSNSR